LSVISFQLPAHYSRAAGNLPPMNSPQYPSKNGRGESLCFRPAEENWHLKPDH